MSERQSQPDQQRSPDKELDDFAADLHARRMPGYKRLQAERGAKLFRDSVRRHKERKRAKRK